MKPTRVFAPTEAYDCKFCGSKYLPPKGDTFGLCAGCWGDFGRFADSFELVKSATLVNRWMARRLMLEAVRMERTGVTGRCEAVAGKTRGWMDGHDAQCRRQAIEMRDGHKVCGQHRTALRPIYVGNVRHNPYTDFARVLGRLAKHDPEFKSSVEAALRRSR